MKNQFEIVEVKINKKVSNRSASQDTSHTPPTTAPKQSKDKKVASVENIPNQTMGYESLTKIEKHYYDQMKVLLKGSSEKSIREAIAKFGNKDISTKRISEILSMVVSVNNDFLKKIKNLH